MTSLPVRSGPPPPGGAKRPTGPPPRYGESDSDDDPPARPPPNPPFRRVLTVTNENGTFYDRFPEWTNPTHPSATDDEYYYPSFRPALLPSDDALDPSDHAMRFGINTLADGPPGRSMMTPIGEHSDDEDRDDDMDARDEEYQAMVWGGFTTTELVEEGVYDPDDDIVPALEPSDLRDAPISPLLDRDRWLNWPGGTDAADPILLYGLDESIQFNVHQGDRVWEVIRPMLVIVTRVLEIHPYWAAILSPCACLLTILFCTVAS